MADAQDPLDQSSGFCVPAWSLCDIVTQDKTARNPIERTLCDDDDGPGRELAGAESQTGQFPGTKKPAGVDTSAGGFLDGISVGMARAGPVAAASR